MKILIDILKKETESLRIQYLEFTREWAGKYHQKCCDQAGWNQQQWCVFFGITPEAKNSGTQNEFLGFPRGFYNTRQAREFDTKKKLLAKVMSFTPEKFIENEVRMAEQHYQDSIIKLAFRIKSKDLDESNLQVKTAHIGRNIETTITDGNKTVRAFTIVASGEIQRPHYRYLIK